MKGSQFTVDAPESEDGRLSEKPVDQDERERRTRTSAHTFLTRCRRAGLEPEYVLEDVRRTVVDAETCSNGSRRCAMPGTLPCFECLVNGGESA